MAAATMIFEILGYVFAALAVHHSLRINGKRDTLSFFSPLFLLVLLIEAIAVLVFNGYYYPDYAIYVFKVPLAILLGWCAIVYVAHHLSKNVFFRSVNLFVIPFFAGLLGVITDLFLEPLAYSKKFWVWNRPDIYFGASVENFISWFFIIFAFTLVFDHAKEIDDLKKRLLILHVSAAGIVMLLIIIILVWKATINL